LASIENVNFEKYKARLRHFSRLDLQVLDDFLLNSMDSEMERKTLFDLLEKRNELRKSIIFCSQREPNSWILMLKVLKPQPFIGNPIGILELNSVQYSSKIIIITFNKFECGSSDKH